ncbi:MAG: alanine-glyoxylate transaminase / serine-glyoxylate transaminase / serine-pyruvate transaminase [Solirubrobacteraceae bacterium]|jgi:alanine-glyoxylate transaminase/serine-glyoxylate transaminase/serine-pyruvate transaminase|nr:alanine-glyoxylate transaminase / serine-glyoxylate transaminase / serine-pyruvate transaminase [Solirubrobacteraceae bacterium]
MNAPISPIDPPRRLLCGPGPANVHPSVLAAMHKPMLGHVDPDLHAILGEIVELLQACFQRSDGLTVALSGTGTMGIEAGVVNLVEPGEKVIIGAAGYFGFRLQEIARRRGASVIEVNDDWGKAVSNDRLLTTLAEHPDARMLAVVHAETSTGVEHPLEELAAGMAGSETLLMADCVTSFGAIELRAEPWGIDYCGSCTQKGLAAPPGMAPIAVSPRALERIASRVTPVGYYADLRMIADYWDSRAYHHTAPILHIYALHEALRLALEEGWEARHARHLDAGRYFQAAVRDRGLELVADEDRQLPQLSAIRIPDGIDGRAVQHRLLVEHGIEVGGGLGPVAPPMIRVGLMGENASRETADTVLAALDAVLSGAAAGVPG